MKKLISLLLCVAMVMCLASCTISKVKVNGVKIDNEIYKYYENTLPKDDKGEVSDEAIQKAIEQYVAINSQFANKKLKLSYNQKSTLSATVNNLWHMYGSFYNEIGVSKQTIYKIETSKEYKNTLMTEYYGENGEEPLSEESVKEFFKVNYAGIRFVTGYLFNIDENGATVPMTDEQKNNTVNSFTSVATMVNEGTAIEEAVGSLGENVEVHNTVVNAFSNSTFPEGFWEKVNETPEGKATAISLGDYVFLVQRVDVFSEEYGYYNSYRTDCLEKMKGEEFSAVIDKWAENYKAE